MSSHCKDLIKKKTLTGISGHLGFQSVPDVVKLTAQNRHHNCTLWHALLASLSTTRQCSQGVTLTAEVKPFRLQASRTVSCFDFFIIKKTLFINNLRKVFCYCNETVMFVHRAAQNSKLPGCLFRLSSSEDFSRLCLVLLVIMASLQLHI